MKKVRRHGQHKPDIALQPLRDRKRARNVPIMTPYTARQAVLLLELSHRQSDKKLLELAALHDLTCQHLPIEELKELAQKIVPKILANRLAILIDSEQIYPSDLAVFPQSWSYKMRCLEFSAEAMLWIKYHFSVLGGSDSQIFTNLVKILATATLFGESDQSLYE